VITTWLIVLPLAGALAVWLLPLGRELTSGLALLIAVAEIGLWGGTIRNFDFDGGLQFEQQRSWFADLGVSYHVGMYPFSFWLIGLTVVCCAVAIGYGSWLGREHPRAYFGLMLFLLGAVIGVFSSQDLLLFYVFFEMMLIPIYVLIGVWGGERRLAATVWFVIYTMVGSLLMLAAIIAFGISQGTFDLVQSGTSDNVWVFLGFVAAFAIKSPLFPFHGWLQITYREAPVEVAGLLSGVVAKAAVFGFIRIALPKFPDPVETMRTTILVLAVIGLVYGSILAFRSPTIRGVVAYSSMGQMSLITLGIFSASDQGISGAVLHSVSHGLVTVAMFILAGIVIARCGSDRFDRLGGMAKGRPLLATVLMTTGIIMLAVPGSANFAGEFLVLLGVFGQGWGYAALGAAAIVIAAMYTLRLISAVLHERRGASVPSDAADLQTSELTIVVPLVLCLLALSVWPAAVSENSFPTDAPTTTIDGNFQ
jgi:NADH-quinone oxidoreductase subunit M